MNVASEPRMEDQGTESTAYSLSAAVPEQPERRSDERFVRLLRVGAIDIGDRRELCLIRNISAGGMMIRAYSDIALGSRISVELKQGEPVSGVVQWIDEMLTGVAFDQPIDVVSLLTTNGRGPQQRLPRIDLECSAWVREQAKLMRANIVNVSQGGVCLKSQAPLTIGADVVVTLPGLTPAAGVVKWGGGGTYGIGFNRSLVLSELVTWLQEQQQAQQLRADSVARAPATA